MHDIETWVQGWTDANSAHQAWFSLNIMPPRLISQMFQAATRTAINSNTNVTLGIEWFMKSFKAQITLANQSFSRTKCTMYVCYPRRDIAQDVYDVVDNKVNSEVQAVGPFKYNDAIPPGNCLNVLGDYSAVTSSQEPTSSTALDRLWRPGATPFMSTVFCRMFKVVKVQHYNFAPGEEVKVHFRLKPRVMSMARYCSYSATAINTTNQYALEAYYQCLKGFPVVLFRSHGQLINDSTVTVTNEFTTQAGADVGQQIHQITGKIDRNVEFYAPFQVNTRATFLTSSSVQSGTGPGLSTGIAFANAKMVYPTLSANPGTVL